MKRFTHLHVHSEYSLLDGAARVNDLVAKAASLGMSALALTDHGVMYGAIAFYKACKQHGIKPILGCEMYLTTGSMKAKGSRKDNPIHHLILLAKNNEGYRNLLRLCSIGHLEGFYYKPRIDLEQLERYSSGLIALSSCLAGEVSQHLLYDRFTEAKQSALRYRDIFGEDFYLELQDHGLFEQKKVNQGMVRLARETGIPLVATNDVHYLQAQDNAVQDILICIGTGKTLDDKDRLRFRTDQMFLKSADEMAALFPHVPEALANTERIAESCEVQLELGKSVLPAFRPIPDGRTAESYLAELCRTGLRERFVHDARWSDEGFRTQAEQRLEYELSVISGMGFADYFLIVWDFIRFARAEGIAIGPGRGSSAGSLVAYALHITDVDPLKYRLLFERFLNPERVSMPDIDIDFSDERRDEVIEYVVAKYGREHVAQIITFGTMAARAAVRDVGRVLGLPYHEVDRAAKLIPNHHGMTIAEAMRTSADLRALAKSNERIAELLDFARRVEGLPRHASTHAAGVVISREPLTHYTPLQEGTDRAPLTQYAMEHLEAIGLLKMDFLGLRNLSIIERTIQAVEDSGQGRLDFRRIGDDDAAVYDLLGRGDTTGIFQMESPGMRRVLKELKPTEFEDIISVLALYRPGPMEFIPQYIQGKRGKMRVEYPHPSLEPILADTYGIIVYQEQIMQIASTMAGFSLGEADLLRRAVSKKKREVLDQERAHFAEGCIKQGYSAEDAHKVYDMIVRFADYGFPRAHATAYGVLAFQTAYLKAHYPAQFMSSLLTSVMGNHLKTAEYVEECRRIGIQVLPPCVNESEEQFTPIRMQDGTWAIRFGLAAVKNVGLQAVEAIRKERSSKPYESLLDFCRRIDLRLCNKRVIESLILCGAFDELPGHRAQKVVMLDDCVELAAKWQKERDDLQLHLFGFEEQANWTVELPEVPAYLPAKQLEMERDMLGLYLSGHPLDQYGDTLDKYDIVPLHHLAELEDGAYVNVVGMIVSVKPIMNKKGKAMAFAELEDRIAKIETVVFPELWSSASALLKKGALVLLQAKLQHKDDGVALIAEQVYTLDDLPERLPERARRPTGAYARSARLTRAMPSMRTSRAAVVAAEPKSRRGASEQRLYIRIAAHKEKPELLQRLQRLLQQSPGRIGVILFYESSQKTLALSEQYAVKPSPALTQAIESLLGKQSVVVK